VSKLLSHTAGLTVELSYSGFEDRDSVQTIEASLTKAKNADAGVCGDVKVGIEPFSKWKYSGGGFSLLQLLVEGTSGLSFNDFLKVNVFQPLNMTKNTYVLNDTLSNRLCEFYNSNNTSAPHFYYTSLATTSLYTTVSDLGIFFRLFLKGNNGEPVGRGQISPESLKLMRKSHWDIMGERVYGLGAMLYIDIENGEAIFEHDGKSTPPINTAIRINPITGDGIIILETGNPDLVTRIASDWVFLGTRKTEIPLFIILLGKKTTMIIIGLIVICILLITIGIKRKKEKP